MAFASASKIASRSPRDLELISVHGSSDDASFDLAFAAATKIVSGSSFQGSPIVDETPDDRSCGLVTPDLAFAVATTNSRSSSNPSYDLACASATKIASATSALITAAASIFASPSAASSAAAIWATKSASPASSAPLAFWVSASFPPREIKNRDK